jgi:hypothetical protein
MKRTRMIGRRRLLPAVLLMALAVLPAAADDIGPSGQPDARPGQTASDPVPSKPTSTDGLTNSGERCGCEARSPAALLETQHEFKDAVPGAEAVESGS